MSHYLGKLSIGPDIAFATSSIPTGTTPVPTLDAVILTSFLREGSGNRGWTFHCVIGPLFPLLTQLHCGLCGILIRGYLVSVFV